ncbi:UDP-N-acetylmuramoyl-L-alanyl-D-glutamate--2,6-diaminopimelate ligase [Sporosarcina sp. 179-K 3D1 HS]|uniref:UDP-N-acetylmuramoyl-L-alanyl-D-glutamate--2, 6-diaminopimelate ligase n=1 Tax=Sporosarcina sp. 179-K 3D1 HS TaxID=3232169 RepID=UPI00399F8EB9
MLHVTELLKDWPCTVTGGQLWSQVTGITERAATVEKGFIFVARKGKRQNGANYIEEAIRRGAIAIVVDRPSLSELPVDVPIITVPDCSKFISHASARLAGDPSERLTVIAVTGTNGKTTVTHFIGQLLARVGIRCAVIGTIGVFIDGCQVEYECPEMTTLPSEYLHPLLAYCESLGVTHVVLEASSIGLANSRLAHCHIDIGLLLNIGQDHYEEHGGRAAYIAAKQRLLHQANAVVVNQDDEQCRLMAEASGRPAVHFGITSMIGSSTDSILRELAIPGDYNKMNAIAAVSALIVLGYSENDIVPHIRTLELPEGRLQRLEQDGIQVYIDYAHTPDALEAVLQTLSTRCYGKLITVFGCGGERDKGKRAEMGELAVRYSSLVFITSDNPRNEDPALIVEDIKEGFGGDCSTVEAVLDRKDAIRQAIFRAAPGDIVLIAGKGHEKYQQTATGVLPFSDVVEAERALSEKTHEGKAEETRGK